MRFMIMVKANDASEAGIPPSEEILTEMGKFNEKLINAGILLDAAGLLPSSKGAKIRFDGSGSRVIDGPFAETKELIAGYWLIQTKSRDEALEWARRCPNPHHEEFELEVRQLFELEDHDAVPADAREL